MAGDSPARIDGFGISLTAVRLEAIDLPDELVTAQREGRLVLFVGAGASVAAPSRLPTFEDLAKQIGEESGTPYPGVSSTSPDRFLGQLEALGVDVHIRVHKIIDCPDSRPNSLHRAIVALASTSNSPRVVTTNYDRHLSSCAPALTEFVPPALPMNDDFTGIVYLHGSVRQCPENLIVTKADFGKAYLNDGWATAVLRKIFRDYVVLFIGFSHRDTLMEYLAAGLPSGTQRYTLCEDPDDNRWDELGIQSIGYPCHKVLPQAIDQWTERARMSLLDHAERVRQLVEGVPVPSSVDESYLEDIITDPQMISFFTDHARGPAWLEWVTNRDVFDSIFEPLDTVGEVGTALGWWFCRHFVVNPALSDTALRVIGKRTSRLGPALAARVISAIRDTARQGGFGGLHRWISLAVAGDLAPGARQAMWRLLIDCDLVRDSETFLLLFDRLAEPVSVLDRTSTIPVIVPSVNVVIKEPFWFGKVWQRSVVPNLDGLATDLMPIIDRHLRLAHRLTLVVDDSVVGYSPLSTSRTAIASQGRYDTETIDPLIDAARDTLESLLQCSPDESNRYLESWNRSSSSLLRRLAVHGWTRRSDRDPDKKIEWLMEHVNLLNPEFYYEIREYLKEVVPNVSDSCSEAVVEYLLEQVSSTDLNTAYAVYGYLTEIVRYIPRHVSAQEGLAVLQTAHPDWQPPGEPVHILPPAITPLPPSITLTVEELHDQIAQSVTGALETLTGHVSSESVRDQYAVSKVLQETVQQYTADGGALLSKLVEADSNCRTQDQKLVSIILSAWRSMPGDLPFEDVMTLLPLIWDKGSCSWLDELDTGRKAVSWRDAINHWAGMVAELVVLAAVRQRVYTEDDSARCPDVLAVLIEKMVMGTHGASEYAQVIVASRVLWLFTIDRQLSFELVLPLFDPTIDESRALRCWDGQLISGGLSRELLEAGLLEHYVKIFPLVGSLGAEACRALIDHLACIALIRNIDPLEEGWLRRFTVDVEVEQRVQWIRSVTTGLRERSVEDAEEHWTRWMHSYWNDRLESKPRRLTVREATALAEWPLTLGASFQEAVACSVQFKARLDERSRVLVWLDRSLDFEERYPRHDYMTEHSSDVARLIMHLLSNTAQPYSSLQLDLKPVIQQMRDHVDNDQIALLLNEGLRLGIPMRSG